MIRSNGNRLLKPFRDLLGLDNTTGPSPRLNEAKTPPLDPAALEFPTTSPNSLGLNAATNSSQGLQAASRPDLPESGVGSTKGAPSAHCYAEPTAYFFKQFNWANKAGVVRRKLPLAESFEGSGAVSEGGSTSPQRLLAASTLRGFLTGVNWKNAAKSKPKDAQSAGAAKVDISVEAVLSAFAWD